METSAIRGSSTDVGVRLAKPFFDQGATEVFMATCCGRLYAGIEPPKSCRGCQRTPIVVSFTSIGEVNLAKIPEHED